MLELAGIARFSKFHILGKTSSLGVKKNEEKRSGGWAKRGEEEVDWKMEMKENERWWKEGVKILGKGWEGGRAVCFTRGSRGEMVVGEVERGGVDRAGEGRNGWLGVQ